MSKAKGRKRSNYGVSIYQEAPVVVQRKRKATEISIVENGIRVIGKASDGASAAAPAALAVVEQQSSSSNTNSVWCRDGLPQQQKEVTTGVPMRRTRSQDRAAKLRGSPMRPTISGIAEALGVDEPDNRAQLKPDDSTRALEFRPTISGLEEALEREAPILEEHQETVNSRTAERLPSCAASTRTVALHACTDWLPLGSPPLFRPTTSGLQEVLAMVSQEEQQQATSVSTCQNSAKMSSPPSTAPSENVPMRKSMSTVSGLLAGLLEECASAQQNEPQSGVSTRQARNRGGNANISSVPLRKTLSGQSGLLASLLSEEVAQSDRGAALQNCLRECLTSEVAANVPMQKSASGSLSGFLNLLGDELGHRSYGEAGLPLRRTRSRDAESFSCGGSKMQRSVSNLVSNLLSAEAPEYDELINALSSAIDTA